MNFLRGVGEYVHVPLAKLRLSASSLDANRCKLNAQRLDTSLYPESETSCTGEVIGALWVHSKLIYIGRIRRLPRNGMHRAS